MSLSKGHSRDEAGPVPPTPPNPLGHLSRRSSSQSESGSDVAHLNQEDVGVSKRFLAKKNVVGRIKVGFILTKGQLEVEIISGRELLFDAESSLGVYVKVYLRGRGRTVKRKTRLVPASRAPIFKQVIRYDGSLVDNKLLEVGVWQKRSGQIKQSTLLVGRTEIVLDELNLERTSTCWYSLHAVGARSGSSVEE